MKKSIVIRENLETKKFDLYMVSENSKYEMRIKNVNCKTLAGAQRAKARYEEFFNINQ